ncbi:unnamed protein product [Sphagnum balticum]
MAEEVHSRLLQHSDSGHGGEIISIEERQRGSSSDGDLFRSDLPQAKGRWQFKYHHKLLSSKDFQDSIAHTEVRRQYNRRQRDVIEYFKNVNSNPVGATGTSGEEPHEGLAINLSNVTNVVLLIIKIIASIKSRSLAIVASTLESLLDLIAGVILLFTRWSMKRENVYKYPIGKLRVQPVGIVIFAAIMATLGMQVLVTAGEQLVEGKTGPKMNSGELTWLIAVMSVAIIAKGALYFYCRSFKSQIVHAYSLDHNFDMLTNIAGLGAALLADQFYWWIDPAGAMILAIYTIVEWSKTVLENAASLVGHAAPPEFIQKVTVITINHDSRIKRIDTVRAYTFGSLYFVEVDIELPEVMPLKEAHDIGEDLQTELEALPEVERAYVHLDYESRHPPEHKVHVKALPTT